MHPDIKGLECPERRSLPKAIWSQYPQSSGYSYVSLTDKGSRLLNRNRARLLLPCLGKPCNVPVSPPPHVRSAAAHNPSAPLDTRGAAQAQECDGAFIYSPPINVLEV